MIELQYSKLFMNYDLVSASENMIKSFKNCAAY